MSATDDNTAAELPSDSEFASEIKAGPGTDGHAEGVTIDPADRWPSSIQSTFWRRIAMLLHLAFVIPVRFPSVLLFPFALVWACLVAAVDEFSAEWRDQLNSDEALTLRAGLGMIWDDRWHTDRDAVARDARLFRLRR